MNLLLEFGLKSVGLLAIAGLVAAAMRHGSAALRHRIWALAFLGLAALPLLSIRLPEIRVERPGKTLHYGSVGMTRVVSVARPVQISASEAMPLPPSNPPAPSAVPELLFMIWGLGVAVSAGRTVLQLVTARLLTRRGEDVAFEVGLGLPPHTRVVRTSSTKVAMTFGFLRPTIVLPLESKTWPDGQVRAVLLHESAHVRRGDWAWLIFAKVVGALYWLNPLVYWAEARMRAEGELAADNAVVRAGLDPLAYAATLVDLAAGLRSRPSYAALPFVEAGTLKARVAAILKDSANRRPLGKMAAVLVLVLGLAVVVPYAAVRVVEGPATAGDGVFDLGDGHVGEIVAITEMHGDQAISWDIHGALLRRPFPIDVSNRRILESTEPEPQMATVRYVVYRVNGWSNEYPSFTTSEGRPVPSVAYSVGPGYESFEDALGGSYRVLRLDAAPGIARAAIHVKLPAADWKLYGYQTYRQGELAGAMNQTFGLHLAPTMPGQAKGTEASFVLPPELAEMDTRLRFFPDDDGGGRYRGVVGPVTAITSTPPEKITRVEFATRPLRSVTISDLPLAPNPRAVYVPRHFLPEKLTEARNGVAALPDGRRFVVARMSDGRREWSASGALLAPDKSHFWDSAVFPNTATMGRPLRLKLTTTQSDTSGPQRLYDGEGWPLLRGVLTVVDAREEKYGFYGVVDRSVTTLSVTGAVPVGQYQTEYRLRRERSPSSTWSFWPEKEGLRVTFPGGMLDRFSGMDVQVRALDASGKVVTRPDGSQGYSLDPGWVEFQLPKPAADRVKSVEVSVRPYAWIRFPDVAMAPKASSPNVSSSR